MNLISAELVNHGVALSFESDKRVIRKRLKISACHRNYWSVSMRELAGTLEKQVAYTLLKACREAERDYAYMDFGDKWREHCPGMGWWHAARSPAEDAILKKAYAELLDRATEGKPSA